MKALSTSPASDDDLFQNDNVASLSRKEEEDITVESAEECNVSNSQEVTPISPMANQPNVESANLFAQDSAESDANDLFVNIDIEKGNLPKEMNISSTEEDLETHKKPFRDSRRTTVHELFAALEVDDLQKLQSIAAGIKTFDR